MSVPENISEREVDPRATPPLSTPWVPVWPNQGVDLSPYQLRSEKGAASGYAALDSGGKVPAAQLPAVGADLSYDGDWAAGTYQDGDIVVKDGVAYMCVGGPTTQAPSIAPWGNAGLSIVGDELAHAEKTSDTAITATTAATAQTVVDAPAVTLDGSTPIIIEVFAPKLEIAGVGPILHFAIYDNGVLAGVAAGSLTPSSNAGQGSSARVRRTPSAGSHVFSFRAWITGGTGSVKAGDGLGANYLPAFIHITRVLPSPPQFGVGALTPVTYGTSLPASPADGQEAILVDSLTVPTYQWRFRYNAGRADAYKWEFVGGAPANVLVAAAEATGSATFVALTTPGPSFTVPRAGVYDVRIGFNVLGVDQALAGMSYDIGGTAASDAWMIGIGPRNTSGNTNSVYGTRRQTIAAAATALVAKYRVSGASSTFSVRVMEIVPVAVT